MRSGEEALNLPHWTICYFASGGGIAASAVHLLVTKSNKQRVTLVDERAVLNLVSWWIFLEPMLRPMQWLYSYSSEGPQFNFIHPY